MNEFGTEDVIWDLTHIYQDINDENIANDVAITKNKISDFSAKYRGKIKDLSPQELLDAATQLEEICQKSARLSSFADLNFSTQSDNAPAGAFLQNIQEIISQFQKELVSFNLEWASVDEDIAKSLLANPVLAKYKHYLERLRRYRPHQLTEIEEKLLAEMSPVGSSSWNKLFDKLLSQMKFGEGAITQEEILLGLYDHKREIRKKSSEEFTRGLKSQSHILTHVFNVILADKMIKDNLRKFPTWINSMNLANELDDEVVQILVETVISRYDIPQRYYKLKKELLGRDELFDYDRYAPLPLSSGKVIPFEESKDIVLKAYNEFSPEMMEIANKFFEEKWIHAPVMPGKRGGAFSSQCTPDIHPYVMLNYTGKNRDVQTMAHELGHGIHQYLSGRQEGYFNSKTPLPMSETASTFGEMLVFQSLLDKAKTSDEKLSLLCDKLENMFATVFRQIAMNRFEEAIHNDRRNNGELSPERFGEFWIKTQNEMFGDSITLTDNYEIWWSYIPHFLHAPGYVYAYAFGELLVHSLYKKYKEEGESFVVKYLELLASGGNKSPAELLEIFGIRLEDAGFWHEGLDSMDQMLRQAEELVKDHNQRPCHRQGIR